MAFGCAAATIFIVALASTDSGTTSAAQGVSLRSLDVGQHLIVRTESRYFRLTLVDAATGETRAAVSTDGVKYSRPARVFLLGATRGRQGGMGEMLLRMGIIQPGWRMELGLGSLSRFDRALSEPVTEVRLLSRSPY